MAVSQLSFSEPAVNPFANTLRLSLSQKIQICIMTVFVIPIKVFLLLILFFTAWFAALIASIGFKTPIIKPAGPFRVILFNVVGRLSRLFFFVYGIHRIKIYGKRVKCKEAPIMVVAPHSSMFDMFVFFSTPLVPSGLAALEHLGVPFFGTLSKSLQPIYVNRSNHECRKNLSNELQQRIKKPGYWPQIIIYPEGTCTNRLALITFKLGAFAPGIPVQPVLINYENSFDSFSWTHGSPSTFILLWLSLCQISIKASVRFLPIYYPSIEEKSSPKLYANNVRTMMANAANLTCTEHSFEDCRLMSKARSLNLPYNSGLVEYTKLNQKLGIDIDDFQKLLEEFSQIASDRARGLASLDDFAKHLNLPKTSALRQLFDMYDRSNTGFINFREYVLGRSLIAKPAVKDISTIKMVFDYFDQDDSSKISKERFKEMMNAACGVQLHNDQFFSEIKMSDSGSIIFIDFQEFLMSKPEYAKLLQIYQKKLLQKSSLKIIPKESNENSASVVSNRNSAISVSNEWSRSDQSIISIVT